MQEALDDDELEREEIQKMFLENEFTLDAENEIMPESTASDNELEDVDSESRYSKQQTD